MLIYYFLQTIELWIFVGILLTALVIEAIINTVKQRSEPNGIYFSTRRSRNPQ